MDYKDKNVCERIKDIMREMSLGQKDLSIKTGVVQSSISAILNGKRSPTPLIEAMSDKLSINKEWLVNGVGLKYENSREIMASDKELSNNDKVCLLKEINALYEKHQSLIKEAGCIMKTVVELNKKLLLSNY